MGTPRLSHPFTAELLGRKPLACRSLGGRAFSFSHVCAGSGATGRTVNSVRISLRDSQAGPPPPPRPRFALPAAVSRGFRSLCPFAHVAHLFDSALARLVRQRPPVWATSCLQPLFCVIVCEYGHSGVSSGAVCVCFLFFVLRSHCPGWNLPSY